jgi:hypothetical protein
MCHLPCFGSSFSQGVLQNQEDERGVRIVKVSYAGPFLGGMNQTQAGYQRKRACYPSAPCHPALDEPEDRSHERSLFHLRTTI